MRKFFKHRSSADTEAEVSSCEDVTEMQATPNMTSSGHVLKKAGGRWFLRNAAGKKILLTFRDVCLEGSLLRGDGKLYDAEKLENGQVVCVEIIDENNDYYLKKRKTDWVLLSKASWKNTSLPNIRHATDVQLVDDMLVADQEWFDIKHNNRGDAVLELIDIADIVSPRSSTTAEHANLKDKQKGKYTRVSSCYN